MVQLRSTTEDPIQLHDRLNFVESQDVAAGDTHSPAYIVEGQDDYVIGVEKNTPVAPEFRDANGDKLDSSTRVIFQKADPQGNPLGSAIVMEANLGQFNYDKMRSDPEYFKTTSKSLLIDEREHLHIYLDIPDDAPDGFSASMSRLTVGDNVTQTGKPVFVREKDDLSTNQQKAVNQASSSNGGGN